MLCVWVHGRDPERVSDGLDRGWHYTKLSLSSALFLSVLACALRYCCFLFVLVLLCFLFCFVSMLSLELCRYPSDLFLSSRPRTVPDWQPRI